jgi:Zn-dependent peptidase ImmA (M78 family)/predicted secreted protein
MAAARLHARLHSDLSRPIDIFRTVQELGIWLNSRPLGNLFGFYLRQGDALGICLNAGHPETLQRYTCAHELGHHVLGHESNLDEAADIDGPPGGTPAQERAAQIFAGNFLMPLGLVNRVLRRLDLYGERLTASDVYQVSRELDVSYTAAVWRLRSLDRIDGSTAARYAKAGAAAAKAILRGGQPYGSARADLWVIDKAGDGAIGRCRVGDEVLLRLEENRSTGFVWNIEEPIFAHSNEPRDELKWDGGDGIDTRPVRRAPLQLPATSGVLRIAADQHRDALISPRSDLDVANTDIRTEIDEADDHWLREVLGTGGIREVVVVADNQGDGILRVGLKPPWNRSAETMATVNLTIKVVAPHELDGFALRQPIAHAARLAA